MSVASAQAQKFYEQVAAERRVFTFLDAGSFLVFPVGGGEVVPFWSSSSRLRRVRELHAKYLAYEADEIALADFLEKTLPRLVVRRSSFGGWAGVCWRPSKGGSDGQDARGGADGWTAAVP